MPTAQIKNIYYETHGAGHPLVLIRGFGSNADHWYCQIPVFSTGYRVVVFDNRGIGRSDRPAGPYTIPAMADDTAGLMDALGIERAHVLGISMGGMIAQELALRNPERVDRLVLGCTRCGGERAVPAAAEVMQAFAEYAAVGTEQAAREVMKCLFAEKTIAEAPDVVQLYREVTAKYPPAPEVLALQRDAVLGHDTWARLPQIQAPTLVLTGKEDVLVPPENSKILADRIPNARLQVIEGGGHQFLVERPDEFNRAVLDFLADLPES
jgi:pimeloyl-ACP methyl ester carboxylesterase